MCCSEPGKVACPYCEYLTCVPCQKTFLTGITKDAHCMNCSKLWDRSTLIKLLPRTFVTGKLKEHRESILFEREQGLMPATQPEVVQIKVHKEIDSLMKGYKKQAINEALQKGTTRVRWPPEMHQLREFRRTFEYRNITGRSQPKVKLVRKCPCTGCKGFLNEKWKCELCSEDICKECNEPKKGEHTCDPQTVETVKLIRSDTKGCPTCGVLIFRSAGCPQMWCVECHTTFDWNTGEIETGVTHNPHYYEYHRRNGTLQRNVGDVPCGGLPLMFQLLRFGNVALDLHRLVQHIQHTRPREGQDPNRANRIKYMLGSITDEQFKFRIQCAEKAREKRRDIYNILDMFVNVATDLLQTLTVNRDLDAFTISSKNLEMYTNEALSVIRGVYQTMVPRIVNSDLKFNPNK